MTPPATWRPAGLPRSAFVLGPASCQDCGALVWFGRSLTRVQGETVIGEVKAWREWGRYAVHNHGLSGRIVAVGVSGDHDSATMRTARIQVLTPPASAPFVSPGVRR